jgi:hypothetical protein
MTGLDGELTRDQLLEAAARAGYRLQPSTLKSWARQGLLPRPEQRHTTGEAGSKSVYPPGTLRQLLAVCELHKSERRIRELRFDVWWEGFWVDPDALRQSLARLLDDPLEEIREIRRRYPDPHDAALALIEQAQAGTGRSPVARLLRHRLGGDEDLLTATVAVLVVAFDGKPNWESREVGLEPPFVDPDPRDLVVKLLGFDRAALDLLDVSEPWLSEQPDVAVDLARLRAVGLLELEHPSSAVLEASQAELERALIDAKGLSLLSPFAAALEIRHGRDAGGLSIFSVADRRDARLLRAWLIRFSLLAPKLVSAEHVSAVIAALSANEAQIQAAIAIANKFPGYKPMLMPGGEQWLETLPPEERETIRTNLEDFFTRNPHLRERLS